jgi:DNA polymerase-3 subunit beta
VSINAYSANKYSVLKLPVTAPTYCTSLTHDFHATNNYQAKSDSRIMLNGTLIETKANQINIVATDGHRMKCCTYIPNHLLPHSQAIIAYATTEAIEYCGDKLSITFWKENNMIWINSTKGIDIIAQTIDVVYPDYTRIIPTFNIDKINLNTKDFKKALDSIKTKLNTVKAIRISMTDKHSLSLVVLDNMGQLVFTLPYTPLYVVASEITWYSDFNMDYLKDLLKTWEHETITINYHAPVKDRSILFTNEFNPDVKAIIMPLRQ